MFCCFLVNSHIIFLDTILELLEVQTMHFPCIGQMLFKNGNTIIKCIIKSFWNAFPIFQFDILFLTFYVAIQVNQYRSDYIALLSKFFWGRSLRNGILQPGPPLFLDLICPRCESFLLNICILIPLQKKNSERSRWAAHRRDRGKRSKTD